MIEIKREDWRWCGLCEHAIVCCPVNECTTCNCAQCEHCKPIQDEARRLENLGLAPTRWDFDEKEIFPAFLWQTPEDLKNRTKEEVLLDEIFSESENKKWPEVENHRPFKEIEHQSWLWVCDLLGLNSEKNQAHEEWEKWKVHYERDSIPFRKEVIKRCYKLLNEYEKELIIEVVTDLVTNECNRPEHFSYIRNIIIPYIKELEKEN